MIHPTETSWQATFLFATAATVACLVPESLTAGTIRHDRDDRVYQMMAQKEGWQAVGQMGKIQPNGEFDHWCTLALIDDQWVLCAAHCIHNFDPLTGVYTEFPPPLVVRIGTQRVQLTPADVFVHPGWIQGGSNLSAGYDIALFRLPAPLDRERRRQRPQGRQPVTRQPVDPGRAIIPLRVNTQRTEVGQWATSVGFGATGTGLTGEAIATSDRRAGVNTIDGTVARLWPSSRPDLRQTFGNERTLVFDFDSPLTNNLSVLGLPTPLDYEYCPARGDSGGPLFLPNGEIAGVVSGGYRPPTNNFSAYGTIAIYTRVSSYRTWIQSVMAGTEPSLEVMIPRLRANGFFPGQPFRGVATPAMWQARENYLTAIASGWIPRTFIGSAPSLRIAEPYGKFFSAPFTNREINPFAVPAAKSKGEVVTRGRQGLNLHAGWGLDSAVGDVRDLPLDFECVSCGNNRGSESNQPTAIADHEDSFTETPENDDALQSVLVEPR